MRTIGASTQKRYVVSLEPANLADAVPAAAAAASTTTAAAAAAAAAADCCSCCCAAVTTKERFMLRAMLY